MSKEKDNVRMLTGRKNKVRIIRKDKTRGFKLIAIDLKFQEIFIQFFFSLFHLLFQLIVYCCNKTNLT